MKLNNIPNDINVELLLSFFPPGTCKVSLGGLHKRNAYHDLVDIVETSDDTFELIVGRNSLYHILPEYMFHPFDRFEGLSEVSEAENFQKEFDAQKEETEKAKRFFAPLDLMLLLLRVRIREQLNVYADTDKIIIDMLGDRMSEKQKQNRFIRHFIPLLPHCKNIRGNKTALTMLLRKVFLDENLRIELKRTEYEFTDYVPRYRESLSSDLTSLYVGNVFNEHVTTYIIHFWSEMECNENFPKFLEEVEELRVFIQDYFIAIDETILFEIKKDEECLYLSDQNKYNYLNYNTNLSL